MGVLQCVTSVDATRVNFSDSATKYSGGGNNMSSSSSLDAVLDATARSASAPSCSVYFLAQPSDGGRHRPIKIGMSTSPALRLAQLQTGNPESVELVHATRFATRQDARRCESELHRVYAPHRIRREWFALDDSQLGDAVRRSEQMARRHRSASNTPTKPETTAAAAATQKEIGRVNGGLGGIARAALKRSGVSKTLVVVIGAVALIGVIVVAALASSRADRRRWARRLAGWCGSRAVRAVTSAMSAAVGDDN